MLYRCPCRPIHQVSFAGAGGARPGLAPVEVSVVEQLHQGVLMVPAGAKVVEVAARYGVSRQPVHNWLAAYRDGGLAGLSSRAAYLGRGQKPVTWRGASSTT
jgi:hypothetical protein